MFLTMISIGSSMIIHCIAEENIFVVSVYITKEILKHHIKDCFKINSKQTIKLPKKGEYVKFRNFKIK